MFVGEAFKIFNKASRSIIRIADVIVMDLHVWVPTHFESFLPGTAKSHLRKLQDNRLHRQQNIKTRHNHTNISTFTNLFFNLQIFTKVYSSTEVEVINPRPSPIIQLILKGKPAKKQNKIHQDVVKVNAINQFNQGCVDFDE